MQASVIVRLVLAAIVGAIPALTVAVSSAQSPSDDGRLTVTIVSSRPDMITGGDALVLASGAAAQRQLKWEINGKPATFANSARVVGGIAGAPPGQTAIAGLLTGLPTRIQGEYLEQMERWLDAIAADTSERPRAEKIVRAKPADLVDACWSADGRKIVEPAVYGNDGQCHQLYPPHSAPRLEAGAPLADDVWKCQLKAIDFKDYRVRFTDTEKARLHTIFPDGVCDWSRPSVAAAAFKGTWQRY